MRGHVRRRGNGWQATVEAGQQPAQRCQDCGRREWVSPTGARKRCEKCGGALGEPGLERRQHVVGVFSTKKAGEAATRAAISTLEAGGDPFGEDVVVSAYLTRWLEHTAGRVRPRTLLRYRQVVDRHIVPVIGHVPLRRIRPAHVQQVMDTMAAAEAAPRSIVKARAVLGSAMRRAVAWDLIPANPVQAVTPPKAERPELAVPDAAGLGALLEAARGSEWEIPILLSVATGARRGEVLAAQWSDLDLATGRLRITGSLQRVDGELQRVAPKTDRARRQVTLPGFARERLRAHRREQTELRLLLGATWAAGDCICDRAGKLIDPDAFSKAFKRIAVAAGLPAETRLHDVRHGVATGWLEQGSPPGDRLGGSRTLVAGVHDVAVPARRGRDERPGGRSTRGVPGNGTVINIRDLLAGLDAQSRAQIEQAMESTRVQVEGLVAERRFRESMDRVGNEDRHDLLRDWWTKGLLRPENLRAVILGAWTHGPRAHMAALGPRRWLTLFKARVRERRSRLAAAVGGSDDLARGAVGDWGPWDVVDRRSSDG